MAFGIGMDQDFDAGKLGLQLGLDFIHHIVGVGHGHFPIDPDMELDKITVARSARAQIVQAAQFVMAADHFEAVAGGVPVR